MHLLYVLLLLGAVVSFGVAAFAHTRTRVNFLALGLLLWALEELLKSVL